MKIQELTQYLEQIAPLSYQESYDNAGLIVGDARAEIQGVLICLDSTEAVIEEAIATGCNLVIAHHPIVFSGLKKITGKNYVERVIIKAIQNNIAIYAAHTNLDNVFQNGVNAKIGERLGLENTRILRPKADLLRKLYTFAPTSAAEAVRNALFGAGAGHIGQYSECSFTSIGEGTFLGNAQSNPHVGEREKRHREPEERIEVIFEAYKQGRVVSALLGAHPYEEVAYDILKLENSHTWAGAGLVGKLATPVSVPEFFALLKKNMDAACIRHTAICKPTIQTVALCGGAGGFLLRDAIGAKADVFVTADYKYHEFFDADGQIIIADIGHYETEQFTIDLFFELITKKFSTFAVRKTQVRTNPVFYA
jgi:dinuclear metal center YbgI/SA1388 family protein